MIARLRASHRAYTGPYSRRSQSWLNAVAIRSSAAWVRGSGGRGAGDAAGGRLPLAHPAVTSTAATVSRMPGILPRVAGGPGRPPGFRSLPIAFLYLNDGPSGPGSPA